MGRRITQEKAQGTRGGRRCLTRTRCKGQHGREEARTQEEEARARSCRVSRELGGTVQGTGRTDPRPAEESRLPDRQTRTTGGAHEQTRSRFWERGSAGRGIMIKVKTFIHLYKK